MFMLILNSASPHTNNPSILTYVRPRNQPVPVCNVCRYIPMDHTIMDGEPVNLHIGLHRLPYSRKSMYSSLPPYTQPVQHIVLRQRRYLDTPFTWNDSELTASDLLKHCFGDGPKSALAYWDLDLSPFVSNALHGANNGSRPYVRSSPKYHQL